MFSADLTKFDFEFFEKNYIQNKYGNITKLFKKIKYNHYNAFYNKIF